LLKRSRGFFQVSFPSAVELHLAAKSLVIVADEKRFILLLVDVGVAKFV
jgi:hypothetical protein